MLTMLVLLVDLASAYSLFQAFDSDVRRTTDPRLFKVYNRFQAFDSDMLTMILVRYTIPLSTGEKSGMLFKILMNSHILVLN